MKHNFREVGPQKTIENIKLILKSIEAQTSEEWYENRGFYTVRITIENTSIGANGKGNTKEQALVSGYGELIERLQNLLPFRINNSFPGPSGDNNMEAFSSMVINTNDGWSNLAQESWINQAFGPGDQAILREFERSIKNGKIVSNLKFKSINGEEEIWVPIDMVDDIYGSNGMAAGNTMEEALITGLLEVIERYACRMILQRKLQLPDITEYVRHNFESINCLMQKLETDGFSIAIKEASVEKDLPVVAVILLDKQKMSYRVNLGARPSLQSALNSAIVELFQGLDLEKDELVAVNDDVINVNTPSNLNKIFSEGSGAYYPTLLAIQKDSEPEGAFWDLEFQSNKEILDGLVTLIENCGFKPYYLDSSIVGFPSCHVLVPGMSEILCGDLSHAIAFSIKAKRLKLILSDLGKASEQEIRELISFLDQDEVPASFSLNDIFALPLHASNSLLNVTKYLLLMMLYSAVQEHGNAYRSSLEFLKLVGEEETNPEVIRYYKIISAIFNYRVEGLEESQIIAVLSRFADRQFVEECIDDLKRSNIFTYLPSITCPDCGICSLSSQCYFINEKELLKRISQNVNI